MPEGLRFLDDEGAELTLDADEATALFTITAGLEAATVSACPECRSRVLAAMALVDVLDQADAHARAGDLIELADEAPTLHVYLVDATPCRHRSWRDPLASEWLEAVEAAEGPYARS